MHKIYQILRNNRQSGPYSLQELLELSLKPHDLVWVEGQSVGWRYPGEIDALKPYVTGTPAKEAIQSPTATNDTPVSGTATPGQPVTAKHIYVSLPARPATTAGNTRHLSEVEELEKKAQELLERVQFYNQTHMAPPQEEESPVHPPPRTLEEMQQSYAAWRQKQDRRKQHSRFVKHFFTAAMITMLVATGAGFTWWKLSVKATPLPHEETGIHATLLNDHNSNPESLNNFTSSKEPNTPAPREVFPNPLDKKEVVEKEPATPIANNKAAAEKEHTKNAAPTGKKAPPAARKPAPTDSSTTASLPSSEKPLPAPPAPVTTDKKLERVDKRIIPLSTLVQLQGKPVYDENQKRLTGLTLTLHNNSTETLQNVAVQVQYYKKGEKRIGAQTVYFKNVPPNSTASLPATVDARSVTAQFHIASVLREDGSLYLMQ